MSDEDYEAWVEQHCVATAAPVEAAAALLANREVFTRTWGATRLELADCTARLVALRKVPRFANEHTDAVGAQLHEVRFERGMSAAAPLRVAGSMRPEAGPACRLCEDYGLVTVPHWRCVEVPHDDPPRLVCYADRNVTYRSVVEVSVRCDLPGCLAGRRQADIDSKKDETKRRMRLTTYLGLIGGRLTPSAVIEMLAAHNRAVAAEARRLARPDDVTRHLFAGLLAKTLEARAA